MRYECSCRSRRRCGQERGTPEPTPAPAPPPRPWLTWPVIDLTSTAWLGAAVGHPRNRSIGGGGGVISLCQNVLSHGVGAGGCRVRFGGGLEERGRCTAFR